MTTLQTQSNFPLSPFFLVNPSSGGGRGATIWAKLLPEVQKSFHHFDFVLTQSSADLIAKCGEALKKGFRYLIACGGDGTLHAVANAIFGMGPSRFSESVLGLLPLGSGDDFKRSLGWNADPWAALKRLQKAELRKIDVVEVHYHNLDSIPERRIFLNIADFGLGAQVVFSMSHSSKMLSGKLRYLLSVLKVAWKQQAYSFRIRIDQKEELFEDYLLGIAANGRFFGGGLAVAPEVEMDDGELEFIFLKRGSWMSFLKLLPALYRGQKIEHEQIVRRWGSSLEVTPIQTPAPFEMDGEGVGYLPLRLQVLPQALHICV